MSDLESSIRQARVDLAAALRMADRQDLGEGVCNHFSVMVPGTDDRFLLNPHRLHWSEVTASSLVLMDNDGNLIEGERPPEPTAFYIHWRLHKAAPHARAILHTHMPYATALTLLEDPELKMAGQTACFFHDNIAYDGGYNGLALAEEEGDRMCAALGNKSVLFLANHGVIVTGATVAEAYNRLYYLERACMHQVMALSTGGKLRLIDEDVARKTAQQIREDEPEMAEMHFAALKRTLEREAPDYKD